MIFLSGFTDSAVFVVLGIYFAINLIILLVLKQILGKHIKVSSKTGYWAILVLLSIIVTFLLLSLVTTITGKGLLE